MRFLGTLLVTTLFAVSVLAAEPALDGKSITGTVVLKELYRPETKLLQTGFADITLREDFTGKFFLFHSEDSNCALLANYLNMRILRCPYECEKPKFKNLKIGAHVRLTQNQFIGRPTVTVEALR